MRTLVVLVFIYTSISLTAQTGSIQVKIPGLKEAKGNIQLCLYDSKDSFLDDDDIFQTGKMTASVSERTYTFTDIPAGEYAIHAYWDVNANGKMDTNIIDIPKEEVGYSQNIFGSMGPPDFEDVSFEVYKNQITELVIIIKKLSHF